jgi:hypothetical protein
MQRTYRQPLVFLLLLVASMVAPLCRAQDDLSQNEPLNQTAVLLFISSETINDLLVPVAEVRETAILNLHEHLATHGHTVLPSEVMDEAAGYWRVRSDWALSRSFLDHLAADLAISRIQVVHLRAEHSNLALITRLVDCPSGQLLDVELLNMELSLPDAPAEDPNTIVWLSSLAELCRSIHTTAPAPVDASPILVLPSGGIGCDPNRALTATASVLKLLLAERRWSIPDPSLVSTTLSQVGIAPARLGPRGRHLLQKTFNTDILFRLNLVAYGESIVTSSLRVIDDDPFKSPRQQFSDFDLIMRRVNLQDGIVTRSHSVFASATVQSGWFGMVQLSSSLQRIDTAAEKLWLAFNNNPKDQ